MEKGWEEECLSTLPGSFLMYEESAFLDEELEGGDGGEDDHVGYHEHGADVRCGREGGRREERQG